MQFSREKELEKFRNVGGVIVYQGRREEKDEGYFYSRKKTIVVNALSESISKDSTIRANNYKQV